MTTLIRRWKDVRFAIRTLSRNPGFAAVAICTLALGIGANSAIFSAVQTIVFRAVPFANSQQLVKIFEANPTQQLHREMAGLGNFVDWQRESPDFQQIEAYHKWNYNLTGTSIPQRLEAVRATGRFFDLLKVNPHMGRLIQPADARPGSDEVVVISYGLWQRMFAGESSIIGKSIELDGLPRRIIGVLNPDFRFPSRTIDLWLPLTPDPEEILLREGKYLHVLGRLKNNVPIRTAEHNLNQIAKRLAVQHPNTNEGWGVEVFALNKEETRNVRTGMWILLGGVGFVLLIACTNLAHLFLARGLSRQKEYAIRAALGASRTELFIQVLAEGFVIAIVGGGLAILISLWIVELFSKFGPKEIPTLQDIHLDITTLLFTLALSLVTSFLFATLPAYRASKSETEKLLKEKERGSTSLSGFRSMLVVVEVSVAFMLLIGAGLLIQSFTHLVRVDPGFQSDHLLTLRVWLSANKYDTLEKQNLFFDDLITRIHNITGVESVGAIQDLPLGKNRMSLQVNIEGHPLPPQKQKEAAYRLITPEYFRTMKIPVIYGRSFAESDRQNSEPVAIVNRFFAERFWPKGQALGKRIQLQDDSGRWSSIVGVTENIKQSGLDVDEGLAMYQPYTQRAIKIRWMTLIVRSGVLPDELTSTVREQLSAIDRDQPLYDIRTMDAVLDDSIAKPRFIMFLMSLFAGTALALSVVGVYGLISYNITQMVPEIGIRMALGATRQNVLVAILYRSLQLTVIALGAGILGALTLTRFTESLLFGITHSDAMTFVVASLTIFLSVLLASYLPARKAASLDPISVLRYE